MTPLRLIRTALIALFMVSSVAFAQDIERPDYDRWDARATAAEETLERGAASNQSLEDMRANIAEWRDKFLIAQQINGPRIQTLQSQLDALGPKPEEEGAQEPEDIAARREELNSQLIELRAPVLRAEEAFSRADGIISRVDTTIRERQAEKLLELGQSPLNPEAWAQALSDLTATLTKSWQELKANAMSSEGRAQLRRNLPLIGGLLILGLVLIANGDTWARRGVRLLRGDTNIGRGRGVWRFLVSLGQILLPLFGIYALTSAVIASGMLGGRWTPFIELIPAWATVLLGIRWLADRAFHEDDQIAAIELAPAQRRQGRRLSNMLALVYVLREVLDTLTAQDGYAPTTSAVLAFPLLVLAALFMARLARLGRLRDAEAEDNHDQGAFRRRLATLLAQAVTVLSVLGPVFSAVGYTNLGEGMVYPAVATLGLFGLVLVLQVFINDLYRLATGVRASEADNLVPVVLNFVLILVALPALALVWGARIADLTEIWARTKEGFAFGDTVISPTDFLIGILVFVAGMMLTRLSQGALRSSVLPRTKLDEGGKTAVVSGVGYLGICIAVLAGVTTGGVNLSSLAIVAGALSVGIGFGLQTIVSNFVSGIILLIERPISPGDWIEVGGVHGIVKDISVRSTRVETFDKFEVIIPNADFISGQVRNYTRGNVLGRVIVPVGVAYGTETRKVEKILLDIARQHELVLMNPEPYIYFKGFGADSMDFEIRAILRDVNGILEVQTEMNHQIVERFAEAGIEIPFAQRDIWLRNPEALTRPREQADAQHDATPVASPPRKGTGERPGQGSEDFGDADPE